MSTRCQSLSRLFFQFRNSSKCCWQRSLNGNNGRRQLSVSGRASAGGWSAFSGGASADEQTNAVKPKQNSNKTRWNRAVSDAEKLVGYPNMFHAIRNLPGDDIFSIFAEIRKLVGTNHPVVKIAKRLIYDGRNNMQVRGLIVLLIANISGIPVESLSQQQLQQIGNNQQILAEQVEMIHTAHYVHRSVVNLRSIIDYDPEDRKDAEYGNKVAILVGDFLLASASYKLAMLRNLKVFELLTVSIRNFVEGNFLFQQDRHGVHYPTCSSTVSDWEMKSFLCSGSLLANGCRAATILSQHDEHVQAQASEFGRNLAFAWQVFSDVQMFDSQSPPGAPFELCSLPVIIHLQRDPSIVDMIAAQVDHLDELDYKKIREMVENGGGLDEAKKMASTYTQNARQILDQFPPSDVRVALENIIEATAIKSN